jgi:hypothetical protein
VIGRRRRARIARREAFAARVEATVRALKAAREEVASADEAVVVEPPVDDWGEPAHGRWRLAKLEEVAREVAAEDPKRSEQLAFYLEALRPLVDRQGLLPASVDRVVSEAFDEFLPRA